MDDETLSYITLRYGKPYVATSQNHFLDIIFVESVIKSIRLQIRFNLAGADRFDLTNLLDNKDHAYEYFPEKEILVIAFGIATILFPNISESFFKVIEPVFQKCEDS